MLAAGNQATAANGYLAGQLEVLAGDIKWRIFVVGKLDTHPVVLTQVPAERLWTYNAGVTSEPIRTRRGTVST